MALVVVILGVLAGAIHPRISSSLRAARGRTVVRALVGALRTGESRAAALGRPLRLRWDTEEQALLLEDPLESDPSLDRFRFVRSTRLEWSQSFVWILPVGGLASGPTRVRSEPLRLEIEIFDDGTLETKPL